MTGLPNGWNQVRLDDLKAAEPRSITDGPFGSNLTSSHYTREGARVVRLQNIGDGAFNDAPAFISMPHFEDLRRHEVLPGDLLIASLGEDLPRACLAPPWLGPAIVKADCIRVRLGDLADRRWVMYAMQTPAVRHWAREQLHGVGRPRLGLKVIREIPVPLPPVSEQRRIVEILEDHLSHLDAAEASLTAASRRRTAWAAAALDESVLDASEGVVPLASVVDRIEAGRSFGGPAPAAADDEWGIIKVSAMTWGEFRPGENKRVADGLANPAFEIKAGDLLVSRANTSEYVGAPVLVRETRPRLLLSDKSLRVVPKPGVNAEWLTAVLASRSSRSQVSRIATGTSDSMRNISQKRLLSISIPSASAEQQQFVIDTARENREVEQRLALHISEATARSANLRRSLLAAAFSGRLTGRSADTDVIGERASA